MADTPEYIKAFTDKLSEADKNTKKFLADQAPKPKLNWKPITVGGQTTTTPTQPSGESWANYVPALPAYALQQRAATGYISEPKTVKLTDNKGQEFDAIVKPDKSIWRTHAIGQPSFIGTYDVNTGVITPNTGQGSPGSTQIDEFTKKILPEKVALTYEGVLIPGITQQKYNELKREELKGSWGQVAKYVTQPFLVTSEELKAAQRGTPLPSVEETYKRIPAEGQFAVEILLSLAGSAASIAAGNQIGKAIDARLAMSDATKMQSARVNLNTYAENVYRSSPLYKDLLDSGDAQFEKNVHNAVISAITADTPESMAKAKDFAARILLDAQNRPGVSQEFLDKYQNLFGGYRPQPAQGGQPQGGEQGYPVARMPKFTETNTAVPGQTRPLAEIISGVTNLKTPEQPAKPQPVASPNVPTPAQTTGGVPVKSAQPTALKPQATPAPLEAQAATPQPATETIKTGKPFSMKLYRGETSPLRDKARGVFMSPSRDVASVYAGKGEGSRVSFGLFTFTNPLVFESKKDVGAFLGYEEIPAKGAVPKHTVEYQVRELRSNLGETAFDDELAWKARKNGYDAIVYTKGEEGAGAVVDLRSVTEQPSEAPTQPVTTPPAEPPKPPVTVAAQPEPKPEGEYAAEDIAQVRAFWLNELTQARAELKAGLSAQRTDIGKEAKIDAMKVETIKSRLIEAVKATVPKEGQGRFLTAVKNVKTGKQLLRALNMAQNVADAYDLKRLKTLIYKEIATTRAKGGRGKYTADIQRKLDVFRNAVKGSAATRATMIAANSQAALDKKMPVQEAQERNHLIRLADLAGRDAVGLADVLAQIKQFKLTGKLVRLAEVQIARQKRIGYATTEEAIADLSEYLKPRKGYKAGPITGHKTFGEKLHDLNDSVAVRADKLQRAFFEMDKADYNGKMSNAFTKSTNKAAEDEAGWIQKQLEAKEKFIKDSNVDVNKLLKGKFKTDGVELTSDDRMDIYMKSLNEQGLRHLTEGNKYSQEFIDKVIASLTPDEKAFADFLLTHYESQKADIAPVYELLTGIPFPAVENYSPIFIDRTEVGGGTDMDDAADIMKKEFDNAGVAKGFTKARTPGAAQPIKLGAIKTYLRNLSDVGHYIAYAPTVYDLNTILKSREIHDAIIAHSSYPVYQITNKWLRNIASNDPNQAKNALEQGARMIRENSTSAVLIGNLLSSVKQLISLNTSIAEVGEIPMLRGLLAHSKDAKGTLALMRKYSPVAAERISKSIAIQYQNYRNAQEMMKGKRSAKETGMFLTAFIDENAVSITWRAAYDDYLIKHPGEEQAAATHATDVASRTQNWGLNKDLAEYYRMGEIGKLVTMFTQEQNQQYNYIRHDILGKAIHGKQSSFQTARKLFWALLMPALLLGIISRARLPKKPEEAGYDVFMQLVGLIPILGGFIQGGLQGYQYSGAITTELLEGLQNVFYETGKQDWQGVGMSVATFFAQMLGLPVNQTKRAYQAYEAYSKQGAGAIRELLYGKTQAAKQRKEGTNPVQEELDRLIEKAKFYGVPESNMPAAPTPSSTSWLDSLLGKKTAAQTPAASPTPAPRELVPAGTPSPTPSTGWKRIQLK
jgi:hypothetical protein